jgi:hypothetical protein
MAKKELVPDNIQKQFNKVQFKPGEIVFFTWLGTKKYGYVKATKETNWGIQYTVESNNTRYPCGIQIKGYKTAYTTGCIYAEETRSIGTDELKRRSQNGGKHTYSEIIRDTPRPKDEGGSNNRNVGSVSDSTVRKTKKSKSNNVGKDVVINSNDGVQPSNTTKRKNSELDTAIQRQRDFLNGFVKKD